MGKAKTNLLQEPLATMARDLGGKYDTLPGRIMGDKKPPPLEWSWLVPSINSSALKYLNFADTVRRDKLFDHTG
jgi:hypothetical protein